MKDQIVKLQKEIKTLKIESKKKDEDIIQNRKFN